MDAIKLRRAVNKLAGLTVNQKCASSSFISTRSEMQRFYKEIDDALKSGGLTEAEKKLLCRMHDNACFALHECKFDTQLASLAFNVLLIQPFGKNTYLHKGKVVYAEGWMSAVDKVLDKIGVKNKERYLINMITPSKHGITIEKLCELSKINKRKAERIVKRRPRQFYCLILATKNYDKFSINYQYKDPRVLSRLTGFSESQVNKHIASSNNLYSMTFFGASVRAQEYELIEAFLVGDDAQV